MLRNYIKIAWRNLLKNKSSSLINVVGLSIGISTCIVILIFARYESTFDGYHAKADRTYRVVQHYKLSNETLYWNTTAYPLAEALRNDFPEIDIVTQTAGPIPQEFGITDGQELLRFEEPNVLFVDPFYPKTFDIEWMAGDPNSALDNIDSVVLTEDLVRRYYGKPQEDYESLLGSTIMLQGKDPLTITGIVKNMPGNSNQRFNMLIPYQFYKKHNQYFAENWSGNYQGTTFVVLENSDIVKTLESKMASWKKKYLKPEDDAKISYFLQPLTKIHNDTQYGSSPGGYIISSNTLLAARLVAFLILIIAIVNFVNLLTAQSAGRSKEVGVRKVLGGKRSDVTFQFVFENCLVIIGALVLAIFTVGYLLRQLNAKMSIIDLRLEFEWSYLGLILLIGGLTVLLAAIYPAIVMSSFKPISALKSKFYLKEGSGSFLIRKSLMTFQFFIVQLFVIAAIVVAAQMNHFKQLSVGFSSDAVVITPAPEFDKLEVYRNSLLANGSISKVAFGSGPPMAVDGIQLGTNFRLPEQADEEAMMAEMKVGDLNYLDFYDLELLAGRNFTTNKEEFDEFIVNETFIKTYGWQTEEAIGKKIQINEGVATIVGVVKDYHNNSLQSEITPCIILNWVYYQNRGFIKIAEINEKSLTLIEDVWKDTFSSSVFDYSFLDDAIEREYMVERLVFEGFTIFSILAISIACLGLFGLMSFVTARKTKEIGIRKILGATLFQNLSFLGKEFIWLIILAFIFSVPIVYFLMNRWLEGFTYRIELSVWMFLGGGLLTFMIATLTSSFQAVKAARANLIKALRDE